jgi:hypothetical protein
MNFYDFFEFFPNLLKLQYLCIQCEIVDAILGVNSQIYRTNLVVTKIFCCITERGIFAIILIPQ